VDSPCGRFVTLDAAQTIVQVDFSPGNFAVDCAEACGIYPGDEGRRLLQEMLFLRWKTYRRLNEAREPAGCDDFWIALVADWLASLHEDAGRARELLGVGQDLLYGPERRYFRLYVDTVPALDRLAHLGVRLGVVSNWDYTLERVLKHLGIHDRFEFVLASLVEGMEKPDPRFFWWAAECFPAERSAVVHVGDNPLDDVSGARGAGLQALLLSRERTNSEGSVIHSLLAIPEALSWR